MKRFKKWLAAAGLLLCLTAGTLSVYADPDPETKTTQENGEKQQTGSEDRQSQKDREQDQSETPVLTETPVPTEQPSETQAPVLAETLQAAQIPAASETPEVTETPAPADASETLETNTPDNSDEKEQTTESPAKELPKGNLTLAEDIVSKKNGNREFLTVYSREGDFFYIIIDRDAAGSGNVYFLNLVDDQDLYSLSGDAIPDRTVTEDPKTKAFGPEGGNETICTCVFRCSDGNTDRSCALCKDEPEKCKGFKTPDNSDKQDDGQKKPEFSLKAIAVGAAALLFLILFYFLKIRKKEKESYAPELNIEDYLTDAEEDNSDDVN